jgi:hypothetical protein
MLDAASSALGLGPIAATLRATVADPALDEVWVLE